jgi:hypothetical protein
MAFIRMFQPPNVTAEIYEAVNEKAGVAADPPEGLIFHCAGDAGGNWQILDVWESQEHARRFDEERLTPAIESVIGAPPAEAPRRQSYELHTIINP